MSSRASSTSKISISVNDAPVDEDDASSINNDALDAELQQLMSIPERGRVQLEFPRTPRPGSAVPEAMRKVLSSEAGVANPWPSMPASECNKNVAIFTSGGDAPGMNAAVRASAAVCLTYGVKVFAIYYGYQGMVDGGTNIKELTWEDIANIHHMGGTVIGSARCPAFRTVEGRRKAAANLVKNEINCLIAIGGDGTLTGADLFKKEWPQLLADLVKQEEITQDMAQRHCYLSIIGMVGSIDNDMCGFSMTIGCDTALHRICESVDALTTTAQSHQRTFIIEVMGRNCGFLAVMTALACGADYVLVPENPPDTDDWRTAMADSLRRRRRYTNFSLVIVAEGATDRQRKPITSNDVKKVCEEMLGHDTRVTTLGHVQRGGSPSAYDRIMSARCGAEAALAVLNATPTTPSRIVGVRWNKMIQVDLTEAVAQTREVAVQLDKRDYERVMDLRGPAFRQELNLFLRIRQHHLDQPPAHVFNIVILMVGSPACGMNAAAKAITRDLFNGGHNVFGALEGFEGLAEGRLKPLQWESVKGWVSKGGAELGCNRVIPSEMDDGLAKIAAQMRAHHIHGLVCIGGFEAFSGMLEMAEGRKAYPELRIPMVLLPATISNNVPGTNISLGADTALNVIVEAIDRLKQSALSSRRRVFIVETQGNNCGYLASAGALAGGADGAYIREESPKIEDLMDDINHVRRKLATSLCGVFVRNESCSDNYTTEFLRQLFDEEGRPNDKRPDQPTFSTRSLILGHLQQGGSPSPLDRVRGARLGGVCTRFLLRHMSLNWNGRTVNASSDDSACVIGVLDQMEVATPLLHLRPRTDMKKRVPKDLWWLNMHRLTRVLENSIHNHDQVYQGEASETAVNSSLPPREW